MNDKYDNYLSEIKGIVEKSGQDYSKYNLADKIKIRQIFSRLKCELEDEILPVVNYWAEYPIQNDIKGNKSTLN